MIRATFSAETNTIDVHLPKSWAELDDTELRLVYQAMATVSEEALPYTLFRILAGVRQSREGIVPGKWKLSIRTNAGLKYVYVTPTQIAEQAKCLDFVYTAGLFPVRIAKIGKGAAVDAQLRGVAFGDWLRVENLYQGYLSSQNVESLVAATGILYPGFRGKTLTQAEVLNVLNWLVQVKALFARTFSRFFRPVVTTEATEAPNMLETMNNQIRALTGGDVTKEEVILATGCWRALTELDYKAREAEELNAAMAKNKN